jgi:hypothetical protein
MKSAFEKSDILLQNLVRTLCHMWSSKHSNYNLQKMELTIRWAHGLVRCKPHKRYTRTRIIMDQEIMYAQKIFEKNAIYV